VNGSVVMIPVARAARQSDRAVGYEFDAVKIFCDKNGQVTKVPYREHVPPDVTACILWLKNRKPSEWRDVQQMEPARQVRPWVLVSAVTSITSALASIHSSSVIGRSEIMHVPVSS
jgi:hypothetical protein